MKNCVPYFLMAVGAVSGETLQEAIIKDMMPESSPLCSPTAGSTSSDFTFASSQEESKWFDGYSESYDDYNAPWSQLEEHVFNAKMMHKDMNVNRTWAIRLGKGGNIYSMVGPMGETVAPQKRIHSPWIDDVWHSVGVEPPQKEEPFMIHGAGSYQSDHTYSSNVGIPLTEIPFYSPSLGKYCNNDEGECGFAAWAQHGPVPVYWESTMLNFNRYIDCGKGIIEHTVVHHNNMGSSKTLSRLDAPFGSVRFSTLRDVVITDKDSEILLKPHVLGRFDTAATTVTAKDTMGYTIFAEDLPSPLTGSYPLKGDIQYTIGDIGCRTAPDFWGYKAVMCRLEPTVEDLSGTRVAVTFRGTPPPQKMPCDQNEADKCITKLKFKKYATNNYCRPFGSNISCRLNNNYLDNFVNTKANSNSIKFETNSGKFFTATDGIVMWSVEYNDIYSMVFKPKDGTDASLNEIESMIVEDPIAVWSISIDIPPGVGGDITAKNGVINWVKHIQETNAYWLSFYPDEIPGVADIGNHIKTKFPPGSTLEVLYDTGKPKEDNLALAHVYGNDFSESAGLVDGWPKMQVGNANEGKRNRDANIYNIVTTATKNSEGGSHYFRQYFVMDRYSDISEKAANLASQVKQDNYNIKLGDKGPGGRDVHLYSDGTNIGAVVGNKSCFAKKMFVHPKDNRDHTIIIQSNGSVFVSNNMSNKFDKCVLTIDLKNGLTGEIRGGPRQEKLTLNFYTSQGSATGEKLLVDGIHNWYFKDRLQIYPAAPFNTVEKCSEAKTAMEDMFLNNHYINVTYTSGVTDNYNIMDESAKKCTGSTTPKTSSKALFEIKCGISSYIGPDPYHFAPKGFTPDDNKKRPYICNNDATARGVWTILGFFPTKLSDGCLSIQEGYTFDDSMCVMMDSSTSMEPTQTSSMPTKISSTPTPPPTTVIIQSTSAPSKISSAPTSSPTTVITQTSAAPSKISSAPTSPPTMVPIHTSAAPINISSSPTSSPTSETTQTSAAPTNISSSPTSSPTPAPEQTSDVPSKISSAPTSPPTIAPTQTSAAPSKISSTPTSPSTMVPTQTSAAPSNVSSSPTTVPTQTSAAPTNISSSPTTGTSSSPTYTCQDSSDKFKVGVRDNLTCYWGRKKERCLKKEVNANCPVTCETDCTPFDTIGMFNIKKREKSCIWVSKRSSTRCKNNVLRSNCPVTCQGISY